MSNEKDAVNKHECYHCEDGIVVEQDGERWCNNCFFAPAKHGITEPTSTSLTERWRSLHAYDDEKYQRVRMAGGFRDAYWGEGEYCFNPKKNGFSF